MKDCGFRGTNITKQYVLQLEGPILVLRSVSILNCVNINRLQAVNHMDS